MLQSPPDLIQGNYNPSLTIAFLHWTKATTDREYLCDFVSGIHFHLIGMVKCIKCPWIFMHEMGNRSANKERNVSKNVYFLALS